MAMEDEGQAKEIPLATAQPVHAHLGSWWYRQPHWGVMSRSRKDPSWERRRSSADQQPNASREDRKGSLRDLDTSFQYDCRYHKDPRWACTGCAVASGISFACPSSSMAILQKLLPIRWTDFSPQIPDHESRQLHPPSYYGLSNELLRLHLSHPGGIAPPHYSQHALYRPRTS